jgi:glycosyltransferase involved in cell wall biosynthesis
MVSNESHVIERMLDSCHKYIDYWVIQDNGSKDGTQDIIRNFFAKKNIPGFLYETEWSFPGYNRDHALQVCLKTNQEYDWILRIDADEVLDVSDKFDWSILDDTSIQSYNILASQGNCSYHRCWLWNSKLPWKFKHDKRHETIYLEGIGEGFQRATMPNEFRHIVHGDGNSWFNPLKFYSDALEIEKDLLTSNKMKTDLYHLFYIAKSYYDYCLDHRSQYPFGNLIQKECSRRSIFFFERYLDISHDFDATKKAKYWDEMAYVSLLCCAELSKQQGQSEIAIQKLELAEQFCPERNEHLLKKAELYCDAALKKEFLEVTTLLMNPLRKNPFPKFTLFINNDAYYDTGTYVNYLHKSACLFNNIQSAV